MNTRVNESAYNPTNGISRADPFEESLNTDDCSTINARRNGRPWRGVSWALETHLSTNRTIKPSTMCKRAKFAYV